MKQYEAFLRRIFGVQSKSRFRTSFEVVASVMGVPKIAVETLAKGAGIVQSEWIDEDSLGVYEDAYIRKLKVYFKRMMRNANEMGCEDLRTFISFCKTFKKPNIETFKICRWEDIDEDAIREQFRIDVKERSQELPQPKRLRYWSFDIISKIQIESRSLDSELENLNITNHNAQQQHLRREVLRAVTSSLAYKTRLRRCTKTWNDGKVPRAFYITAHYYIYCREDKEDHHVDTILERHPCRANLSINSTLMAS